MLALLLTALAAAQDAPAPLARPAADLYLQLRNVGLDPKQIFTVRDASLDLEDLHFSFTDGSIAFTEAVDGHVTGALFVGEGELLFVPPSQVERQSLQQFTGAAVLNERFRIAYLRFNDATMLDRIRPRLRPDPEAAKFYEENNGVAKNLSENDALRSLIAMTRGSSVSGTPKRFLRARLSGVKMGTFDVLFDTSLSEQIAVGQARYTEFGPYYDLWTSFPMHSLRAAASRNRLSAEENAAFDSTGAAGSDPGIGIDDGVDITRIKVKAAIRLPRELAAESEISFDVRSGGERTVVFELSRFLKVSEVQNVSGPIPQSLEYIQNDAIEGTQLARRGNDLVAVVFPQPLRVGQKVKVRFKYAGPVLSEAGGGLVYVGARGVWCPNRGITMSEYEMEFRSPPGWKLLATGERISSTLDPDSKEEITQWRSNGLIPLAGFNIGRYEMASATATVANRNGVMPRVETYAARAMEDVFNRRRTETVVVPLLPGAGKQPTIVTAVPTPPDPLMHMNTISEQAAHSMDFFSRHFGPYPFSSLALTQMPGGESQGWPGLIFLSSFVFLNDNERPRLRGDIEMNNILYDHLMVAHEVAHQWWGDTVNWKSYRDTWLMESLSQYSALLQLEQEDPSHVEKVLEYYRHDLMRIVRGAPLYDAGPVTLGVRLNSSHYPDSYNDIIYGRGAWMLHMLRMMLRDEAMHSADPAALHDPDALFFSALRTLHEKNLGKPISTRDLQSAFEAVLPKSLYFEDTRSLDWFFQGWVNGSAMPGLELKNVVYAPSRRAGKLRATALLVQTNAPEQLITNVPVYAANAAGELVYIGRFFADGPEIEISFDVSANTTRLVLDPFHTVLTRP